MASHGMSLTAPQAPRLGRYQLLRRLALGGTAEVLLGQVVGSAPGARPLALKRLLPQFATDAEMLRMLVNEARLLSAFSHPNIVQVMSFSTDSQTGQQFMVMEYIEGLDLRAMMRGLHERGQRMSPGVAARIMIGVLEGLGYAHQIRGTDGKSMNVVHRDLSPQNIVVSIEGVPKLIDFGVVKAEINEGDTKTGQLKGSVAYMAPEQIGGRSIDGRADLFAVGVCLYELVAGVNPFRRNTELATFNALLDEQPGPMSRWAPGCPPELEEVVRGALAKQRDGRYRTAQEMRAMLERVPDIADDQKVAHVVRGLCQDPFAKTHIDTEADTLDPGSLDALRKRAMPVLDPAQEATLERMPRPLAGGSLTDTLESIRNTQAETWLPDVGGYDGDTIAEPPPPPAVNSPSSEHETALASAAIMPRGPGGAPLMTVRGTPAGGPPGPASQPASPPRVTPQSQDTDAAPARATTAPPPPPALDRTTIVLGILLAITISALVVLLAMRLG